MRAGLREDDENSRSTDRDTGTLAKHLAKLEALNGKWHCEFGEPMMDVPSDVCAGMVPIGATNAS